MGAEPLLHAAVINNARWCDVVCRSHGYPGEFTDRIWISVGHALPFYPNAITLAPDVTAAEAANGQDPSRPYSVKDSFARVDLASRGLTPLSTPAGSPSRFRRTVTIRAGTPWSRLVSWPDGRSPGPAAAP